MNKKIKKLEDLSANEFKKLVESGLLMVIYPDTPSDYVHRPKDIDRPRLNPNPDWSGVISQTEETINDIVAGTYHSDRDDKQYLWEEVMKALYGRDFFNWFNKNVD